MNYLFLLFLILIPVKQTKADVLTTLIIGSMFVDENKHKVAKTEFQIQVEEIENKLPIINGYSDKNQMIFYVNQKDAQLYKNYFLNKGYSLNVSENKLIFDLSINYQNMIVYKKNREENYKKITKIFHTVKYYILAFFILYLLSIFFKLFIESVKQNQTLSVALANKLIEYVLSLRK